MTEPDDGDGNSGGNGGEPDAAAIWYILGLIAGVFLVGKVVVSQDLSGDTTSTVQNLLLVALFLAPMFLLGGISKHLSREAARGKISWETYWTTMVGITVPVLALLGITSIDDVLDLANAWSAHDK
ncbi:hypothetical protein [Streptomyces sp. NPDC090445]|uniref:hypothetical protein n=1 Tax=Streptomyces sp. NPDC090445 TaxID=3365963 RepID=UPI0038164269